MIDFTLKIQDYTKIKTDSRTLEEGDLFLALIGNNYDGHNYINEAFQKKARFVIAEKVPEGLSNELQERILLVPKTLNHYHLLAKTYKDLINPITIAVTGSAGKTTMKNLLASVLKQRYSIHVTAANENNEIGLPKTILNMPETTELLILEMGMRGKNQIKLLSETAEPNIAIITNIGTAHIELLGSREAIRDAKLEILAGLKGNRGLESTLLVDSNLYQELQKLNFINPNTKEKINANKIIEFNSETQLRVQGLISEGLKADISAVYKVALMLGLNDKQIQQGLASYRPDKGRGQFIYDKDGNLFIDETYNSNTVAVVNSCKAMLEQFPQESKYAVLGDILESDPELIEETFAEIKSMEAYHNFKLIDVRNLDIETIQKLIENILAIKTDSKRVFLLKASRKVALERILCLASTEREYQP